MKDMTEFNPALPEFVNHPGTIPVCIRWMVRRDMPEVLRIEWEGFEFPWERADFVRTLSRRNCIGMVAERGDRVVGYMVYEFRRCGIEVYNLCIAAAWRRQRVASQMIAELARKVSQRWPARIHCGARITAYVAERNLPAQQWLRALDFRAVAIVRDHFQPPQDAYRFVWRLPPEARGMRDEG